MKVEWHCPVHKCNVSFYVNMTPIGVYDGKMGFVFNDESRLRIERHIREETDQMSTEMNELRSIAAGVMDTNDEDPFVSKEERDEPD